MSSSRTLAKFQEFNENPSVCSAWLKDKDRCCKRKIAAKDQERKNSLFRSISGNQIYGGDEARELAGLHFCNGWHRPGGKHAIPSSEIQKALRAIFQASSETATTFTPVPQRLPGSINLSEPERLVFSNAESGTQFPEHMAVPLATRQLRQNNHLQPQALNTPSQAPTPTRQTARVQAQNFELPAQTLTPTRQSARIRVQNLDARAQAPIPTRRSARLRGQEPSDLPRVSATTSNDQSSTATPSRPATRSRRTANTEETPSLLPAQRFAQTSQNRFDPRNDRAVDINENCSICWDPLEDPSRITRCNNCCNDFHLNCVNEWFSSQTSGSSCSSWYVSYSSILTRY